MTFVSIKILLSYLLLHKIKRLDNNHLQNTFMRKIIIISFLFATLNHTFAQNKELKEKVDNFRYDELIIKDRLFVDVFTSRWMNFNSNQFKQRAINQGVNASLIFDLLVKRNSPFSFGIGLGVTNHNLHSNAHFFIDTGYTTAMKVIDTSIAKYKRNNISFTNLNVPIEFRYFHKSGFKVSLGVRVGLNVNIYTRYYGKSIDGRDENVKLINKQIPNKTKIPVEFAFRCGWKYFGINASYMVTNIFDSDKGPQMHPFNMGISIALY